MIRAKSVDCDQQKIGGRNLLRRLDPQTFAFRSQDLHVIPIPDPFRFVTDRNRGTVPAIQFRAGCRAVLNEKAPGCGNRKDRQGDTPDRK